MPDPSRRWNYPDHIGTEQAWFYLDGLGDWASHIEEEAEPGSDDLYTAQELYRACGMIRRLLDERDSLIDIASRAGDR